MSLCVIDVLTTAYVLWKFYLVWFIMYETDKFSGVVGCSVSESLILCAALGWAVESESIRIPSSNIAAIIRHIVRAYSHWKWTLFYSCSVLYVWKTTVLKYMAINAMLLLISRIIVTSWRNPCIVTPFFLHNFHASFTANCHSVVTTFRNHTSNIS